MLFIQLLTLALGSLAICYGVGTALTRALKIPHIEVLFDWFLQLLSGIVVVTASYAIYQTRGATIMLPVLLLHIALLYSLRQPSAANVAGLRTATSAGWLGLAVTAGVGAVVFAGQYLLVYEPGSPFLQTPFQDYVFYSRLTLPLNGFGIETNSLETVFPQFQTAQPYHYLDIWFNAFLVRVTGLPSVWVFFVSAATVLITGCGLGFAAIYRHFGTPPGRAVLLALVTLTVTGTTWTLLTRHPFFANGGLLSSMLLAGHPKLAPVYLFLLLAGLLLLRERFGAASVALAAVPLVSVATAPAVGIGLAGLAAYLFLSRQVTFRTAFGLLVPTLLSLFYVGLFYLLQPRPYEFPSTNNAFALASIAPGAGEVKLLVNIGLGVILNYATSFAGYVILAAGLLLAQRRLRARVASIRVSLVWFGATLLGAVLMRTIAHHYLDGYQFFSNVMVPLTAIVLAVVLGRALQGTAGTWAVAVAGGLAVLALVNIRALDLQKTRFSPQFLQQVGPVLRGLPNRGGFLMADADYRVAYMMSADSYTSGTYVADFKNDYLLLSLSAFVPHNFSTDTRFARDSVQAEQIKRRTTLYRLAKFQALAGRPVAPDSLPLALVRRAGLAFICASRRAALPEVLRPLVRASYRDAYSGETLYVLRPLAPTGSLPSL